MQSDINNKRDIFLLKYLRFFLRLIKRVIRKMLSVIFGQILLRPQVRSKLILVLNHFPRIRVKVKTLISKLGLNSALYSHVNYQDEIMGENVIGEANLYDDRSLYYGTQIQVRNLDGKNYEKKSPLEKWFS